ncbi:recombinase family protein [Mycolicibacterium brisbanense]|uniref:Recombinase n=1 Tax=Mycolicibacterium brisbanense TaxID=146020 RepID=A0A100W0H3_9MYCO|nr:recombinase family protein [Mycolicibacterium brisbanense]MCV7161869.1 recombinase family protein [Mycolicibacterium brisbanense]GAS89382.1 recombinase [Mycolicibacterium brisbanense]
MSDVECDFLQPMHDLDCDVKSVAADGDRSSGTRGSARVDPAVAQRIVEMTRDGLSTKAIADRLTADGVSRTSLAATSQWTRQAVRGVLARNELPVERFVRVQPVHGHTQAAELDWRWASLDSYINGLIAERERAAQEPPPEPQRHSEVYLEPVDFSDEQLRWW